jgi:hypothetical protein
MIPEFILGGGVVSVGGILSYVYYNQMRVKVAESNERRASQRAEAEARQTEHWRMAEETLRAEERLKKQKIADAEAQGNRQQAEADEAARRLKAEVALRAETKERFRRNLIRDFGQTKASEFPFNRYVAETGISYGIANEVADEIYVNFVRWAVADGIITPDKRLKMDALATGLAITQRRAEAAEREEKNAIYRKAVASVLADKVVTDAEAVQLESLRQTLGVAHSDAIHAAEGMSGDAYIAMLSRIVESGVADDRSRAEVDRFKRALVLTDEAATRLVRDRAVAIYRRAFAAVIQDGVVTADEETLLTWLQGETGLTDGAIKPYLEQLAETKELAGYRAGRLPSIPTRKLLEGGEICHWDSNCGHNYRTTTKDLSATGELIVTSKRVRFLSASKNVSFAPWKIFDLEIQGRVLSIKTDGSQGTGGYIVDRPNALEAILVGLARKGKYTSADGYASSATRHIPGEVKREVWARDRGRCIQCKSVQYIEYDHIIPHSKGGANTVKNIQLLCRNCNSLKGDRI